MGKDKTRTTVVRDKPEESDGDAFFFWANSLFPLARSIVRWTGAVFIMFFVYKSLQVLAGKETSFKTSILAVLSADVSKYVYWIIVVFVGGWGYNERRMRRNYIQRNQNRIHELEERIDPGRSSSGLTSKGDTPWKEE